MHFVEKLMAEVENLVKIAKSRYHREAPPETPYNNKKNYGYSLGF